MDPILTIAIPTYDNPQQLSWCLRSLICHTEYPFRILVVNNDGNKDGEKMVDDVVNAQNVPNLIQVIHAGSNLGWMGALNVALAKTDTPLFCSLNDDVLFLPADKLFWRKLTAYFNDERVGAVGPSSNFAMGCQNLFALQVPPVVTTSLLIGFCKVIRTQLLKEIGGYDETLPGGDDLDTSIRIIDAGYFLVCDRTVFLYHIGQQTGRRIYPGQWDSRDSQEKTNNALIKKHGVKEWYKCFTAGWGTYKLPYMDYDEKIFEDGWYAGHVKQFKAGEGLNVGCGSKPIDGPINIDIDPKGQRGSGIRKFFDSNPDVVADARNLPYDPESMKYICAAHILEHLLDPVGVLLEWKRVLAPGGFLYMTLPNHNMLQTIIMDYTHLHAYTPDTIGNLLKATGWEVESVEVLAGGNFGVIARKPLIRVIDPCKLQMSDKWEPIIARAIPEEQVLLVGDGN